MICYKLLSWQGTYPRPTGKGCIVLTGINLIQFEVSPVSVTYKEKSGNSPLERVTNQLLTHLKKTHHTDFKFMKVIDLTLEDSI